MLKAVKLISIFPFKPQLSRTRPRGSSLSSRTTLWVSYALIAANSVLLLSYFVGVNGSASTGYEIKKLQTSISALTAENKKLGLKVSEQVSIATLHSEIAGTEFVPVGTTEYLHSNQYSKK